MPQLRKATERDAALVTEQRCRMFDDNGLTTAEQLVEVRGAFTPWVRERLADGRYVGLFLEDGQGACVASAGILFQDFAPHWLDAEPMRPYLLNFYTEPLHRGNGFAKQLLAACVEECRARGAKVVSLHASKFGKPIYKRFGFTESNEMLLKL